MAAVQMHVFTKPEVPESELEGQECPICLQPVFSIRTVIEIDT